MNQSDIESSIIQILQQLLHINGVQSVIPILEIPRNPNHGDLASNAAMLASKETGRQPRVLAEQIAEQFPITPDRVSSVQVAGPGFLNFHLSPAYFRNLTTEIARAPSAFGSSNSGRDDSWHFEYVSANPTGPLNIVSARAATVGSTLVNVFRKRGYKAHGEYYVNDRGGQIQKLGASVKARAKQIGTDSQLADVPEGGYHGEYVKDIAQNWLKSAPNAIPGIDSAADNEVGAWAAEMIRDEQERTLARFGVKFDRWFRESDLYAETESNRDELPTPAYVIEELNRRKLTYEKDGALWFKAGDFGDSDDRVVKTSDGRLTYIVPDIAYHLRKRRRYSRAVNLLGPDHHGHILQLRAALRALLGEEQEKHFFHPVIVQQVNLKRSGEDVKMSKRAGVGVSLGELIDEVGVDAARFFFLRRKTTSPLDFDIELAQRHTDENPVYYVQYAHARICSILRQPQAAQMADPPNPELLAEPEELDLMRTLARFHWTLDAIVRSVEPHPLTVYLAELAGVFHYFYAKHRVIGDDPKLTAARLLLCRAVAAVISEGLNLMGIDAPERM